MANIGARNPKEYQAKVNMSADINARLEALADAAGANKGTMASMALAAGINILEPAYGVKVQKQVVAAAEASAVELTQNLLADVAAAAKNETA